MKRIEHGGMSRLLAVLAWLAGPALLLAGQGDQVIIVYNRRVPESKGLAEFYAEQRQVPASQIFGFNLTTNDNISRAEFRDSLQKPLAKALEDQKLWRLAQETVPASASKPRHIEWRVAESKIRYAVLCYGMPLRIDRDPLLKEEGMEEMRPEFRRDEAAVDSELAVLPLFANKPPLSGPLPNAQYLTNAARLHPTNGLLMVVRLDGPSVLIARSLVEKALIAERDGLWGRAYFDLQNTPEPGLKLGDDWIRKAAEICRRLGFETVVDENASLFPAGFPMSHIAIYCGWYSQDVFGPFTLPNVEFVTGAFAYHLHSFSALDLHSRTRGWAGPLLNKGVTATMGTVNEPYLGFTPDIGVFVARFIYDGFSFGEAAYASQPVLSWQTTVVGDPLYRPFGKNPELQHAMLAQRHSRLIEWSYLRLANLNLVVGKPASEVVALLEQLDVTKQSAVLTEKLADLYAAQGKPASAVEAAQAALKLEPSPEQRLRLRLTLGDRLAAQNQPEAAYANYQALMQESPDYPDKLVILRKLLALAQQLKKDADAVKYEAEIRALSPPPKA